MSLKIIGGSFKGRLLKSPKTSSVRPTQGSLREAVFNICQNFLQEAKFLDIFAGSGAMGLEALSRGASHVTFVEKDPIVVRCLKENISLLAVMDQTEIVLKPADVGISFLAKQEKKFDIIYIDPPYLMDILKKQDLLQKIEKAQLLKETGLLFLEESSLVDYSYHTNYLKQKNARKYGSSKLLEFSI